MKSRDSNRYSHTQNHTSIMHNTQKVEATRWMIDKHNMLYPQNGIFSLKKGYLDTCYCMAGTRVHYVQWKKLVTKGQILYDSTYRKNLKQSNYRQKIEQWLRSVRGEQLLFNGHTVSVWDEGKGLETHGGGDGCTTMRMYVMPPNCSCENG